MKRLILVLILCACFALTVGCTNRANLIQTELRQEFSLSIGQTATITGEDLKVKFVEVVEDSRCPSDVQCPWAGRVSCVIELTQNSTANKTVLTQSGLTEGYAIETYELYQLKFRVEPYPQAGKTINKSDYRLILTISK